MSAAPKKDWEFVKEEAAEWALLTQGSISAREREALEAWRKADPRHSHAYSAAMVVCRDLADLESLPEAQNLLGRPSLRERMIAALAVIPPLHALAVRPFRLAGAAVFALVLLFAFALPFGPGVQEYETTEMQAVELADGSVVTLGANSRLEANLTRKGRNVTLVRGDAFFAVTPDRERPFIVAVGDATIRVVGTKFDVKHGAEEVRVAVVEGTVEVAGRKGDAPDASSDRQIISEGQQVVAMRGAGGMQFRISSLAAPVATSVRLNYVGASLRDIVAEANRYYAPGVELASTELGDLRVTTSYRSTQVETMIQSLADILPLEVSRQASGRIVIRARN